MKLIACFTLSTDLPFSVRLTNRKGDSKGFQENSHSHIPPPWHKRVGHGQIVFA